MKYIAYSKILLIVSVFLIGCANDNDLDLYEPSQGQSEVTFLLKVPGHDIPMTTRSTDHDAVISSVDVFLFNADNDFVLYKAGEIGAPTNENSVKFRTKLPSGDYNVVVITNYSSKISSIMTQNAGFEGLTKAEVSELLVYNEFNGVEMSKMAMYGETGQITITPSSSLSVTLKRMMARIDVRVDDVGFILNDIYLVNSPTAGYISPKWDTDGNLVSNPSGPNVPSNMHKRIGTDYSFNYYDNPSSCIGQIYSPESPAAIDPAGADINDPESRINATCLIVRGVYMGESYYYRIDFTYDGSGSSTKGDYMPLLRNHVYNVNISEVSGRGYRTAYEAFVSYTTVSNMKTRVLHYDEGDIKDVNFNGQHFFGLGTTDVEFEWTDSNYGIAVPVVTDYPLGWDYLNSAMAYDETGIAVDWVSVYGTTGSQVGELTIVVSGENLDRNTDRYAYVDLLAGRITHRVKIIQRHCNIGSETSNCYIGEPNGDPIYIPVYRANLGLPGSIQNGDLLTSELLWTDYWTGIDIFGPVAQISVLGSGPDGILKVTPGYSEGNAVVTVKVGDVIKWSWHIWIRNDLDDLEGTDGWMKSNLGALDDSPPIGSLAPGDRVTGMYYQWGRKDPFPNTNHPHWGPVVTWENSIFTLEHSIQNPQSFMETVSGSEFWAGSNGDESWNDLYGNKTVYDPCPIGWRVPNILKLDLTPMWENDMSWNYYGFVSQYYGAYFTPAGFINSMYFPASSRRDKDGIELSSLGTTAYYWSATPDVDFSARFLFFTNNQINTNRGDDHKRDDGYQVRCIKEFKQ